MRTFVRWFSLLAVAAVAMGGCVNSVATPSVQGKAYVVHATIFGSSMMNCDATSGTPQCWTVNEQSR